MYRLSLNTVFDIVWTVNARSASSAHTVLTPQYLRQIHQIENNLEIQITTEELDLEMAPISIAEWDIDRSTYARYATRQCA